MRWLGAFCNVPQHVAQGLQSLCLTIEFIGTLTQCRSGQVWLSILVKHATNLFQRKTRTLAQGNQSELHECVLTVLPTQSVSGNGSDQADFLVIAQSRCGNTTGL